MNRARSLPRPPSPTTWHLDRRCAAAVAAGPAAVDAEAAFWAIYPAEVAARASYEADRRDRARTTRLAALNALGGAA